MAATGKPRVAKKAAVAKMTAEKRKSKKQKRKGTVKDTKKTDVTKATTTNPAPNEKRDGEMKKEPENIPTTSDDKIRLTNPLDQGSNISKEEDPSSEDDGIDVKILHFPPDHLPTQIFYEERETPIDPNLLSVLPVPAQLLESSTNLLVRERQPPTTYDFLIHLLRTVEILDSPYLNTVQNRIQRALETCDTDLSIWKVSQKEKKFQPINMNRVVPIAQSVVICGCIYRMTENYESIHVSRYLSALQHTILFLNSDQLESSREMLKGELRREDLGDVKITMDRVAQGIDQLLLAAAH